jgi:CRISPR/Cas system endoribonuclease Cas6 (RAMP superfamily)
LFQLQYSHLRFQIQFLEETTLPEYKSSILRGGLGAKLKQTTCVVRHQNCDICKFQQQCTYYRFFENNETPQQVQQKHIRNRPHSYILRPPVSKQQEFKVGDQLQFELILLGTGTDFIAQCVLAFQKFGDSGIGIRSQRGKFSVSLVEQKNSGQQWEPLFTQEANNFVVEPALQTISLSSEEQPIQELDCFFLTPVRLKSGGKYQHQFSFKPFWISLLKRISSLGYTFSDWDETEEFKALFRNDFNMQVESNLTWQEWPRYSSRQQASMKLGGLVGHLKIQGDLEKIYPWLKLGELLHVGKNTTFGLGQYRLLNG